MSANRTVLPTTEAKRMPSAPAEFATAHVPEQEMAGRSVKVTRWKCLAANVGGVENGVIKI